MIDVNDRRGTVEHEGGTATVRFERQLDAPRERVWELLTTAEGLERWLAPATVELSPTGSIDIDFGEGGMAGGAIAELTPGFTVEFNWRFPGEPDSILRLELEEVGSGSTRLTLIHRLLPTDQATGYGAGWHTHLDHLDAALANQSPGVWIDRFNELFPEYQ